MRLILLADDGTELFDWPAERIDIATSIKGLAGRRRLEFDLDEGRSQPGAGLRSTVRSGAHGDVSGSGVRALPVMNASRSHQQEVRGHG